MNILFLSLFLLAEIALVVLTATKFGEKTAWLKNRAIIRAVEAVLLLAVILAPFTHMEFRFYAAMGVLTIRFVFDGIMWLIKRKKANGKKKIGWSVVNCVLSVILIAVSLVPAFIFKNYNGLPTTGEYKVKETSAILVDSGRKDPFETDGSFREVPAHFYYPENADGVYPLIIFSHGAFGYYQSNYSTYAELVSNGYIVVALDHPHHAFFTEDTDGKIVTVDMKFINDAINLDNLSEEDAFKFECDSMKLRTDDENFVLDAIKSAHDGKSLNDAWHTKDADTVLDVLAHTDTDKIGLIGHSMGGAASVALGRQRNDIGAVIDLDGTMLGERTAYENGKYVYYEEPYPVAVLDLINESHYSIREPFMNKHGYAYVNDYVVDSAEDGKTVTFIGSAHMDFTDLPLLSPMLAKNFGSGDIDHEKMINTVNGIVLDWFNYYLKNEGTLDIKAQY